MARTSDLENLTDLAIDDLIAKLSGALGIVYDTEPLEYWK